MPRSDSDEAVRKMLRAAMRRPSGNAGDPPPAATIVVQGRRIPAPMPARENGANGGLARPGAIRPDPRALATRPVGSSNPGLLANRQTEVRLPPRTAPRTAADARAPAVPAPVAGGHSPFDLVSDFRDFQHGPKIPRPGLGLSFVPILGPAWEAAADLQDGNYGSAAFNAAMAVGDALPIGFVLRAAKAARMGVSMIKKGALTANASAKHLRAHGLAKEGEEIHHAFRLNGIKRNVENWRNHPFALKVLPKETHRRLTGSYNGKPRYGLVGRLWHGTTDWMKTVPTAIASYGADSVENLQRQHSPDDV